MRIVFLFPFFCFVFALSLHPAPGSRNLCPGAIISDRLFRRNLRVRIPISAGSAFSSMYTPYTPVCIAPTKTQARLGRSLSNKPHTPRRKVAGYPKSSNSRSLSTAL